MVVVDKFIVTTTKLVGVSMKLTTILISVLLSAQLFGATPLKKGDIAPHSGILITKAEEAKVKKLRDERDLLKKLRFKQGDLIMNQDIQIDQLKGKLKQRDVSRLQKTLYFIGGVLLTGTSVYLAGRLVK